MLNILSIIFLLLLTSCNTVKEKFGLIVTSPNEYDVSYNKNLEIPPISHLSASKAFQECSIAEYSARVQDLNPKEKALIQDIVNNNKRGF